MSVQFAWSWDGESTESSLIVETFKSNGNLEEAIVLDGPKDKIKRVFEVLTALNDELLSAQVKLDNAKRQIAIIVKVLEGP